MEIQKKMTVNKNEYNPFPENRIVCRIFESLDVKSKDKPLLPKLKEVIFDNIDEVNKNLRYFNEITETFTITEWLFILENKCWDAVNILADLDYETSFPELEAWMEHVPEFAAFKIQNGDKFLRDFVNDAARLGKLANKVKKIIKNSKS